MATLKDADGRQFVIESGKTYIVVAVDITGLESNNSGPVTTGSSNPQNPNDGNVDEGNHNGNGNGQNNNPGNGNGKPPGNNNGNKPDVIDDIIAPDNDYDWD
ncbi:hypothetical protein D7X33_49745 [Butyricicoccus sp. 1XD8-22]|nr:hypothetical protein D7X33_49745 [Butyricicoccus sp. 1XD8-22]